MTPRRATALAPLLTALLATCRAAPPAEAPALLVAIRARPRAAPRASALHRCVALASLSPALRAALDDAAREARARTLLRAHPLGVDLDDAPPDAALLRLAPRLASMAADASLALTGAAVDGASGDEVALTARCVPSAETRCEPMSARRAMVVWSAAHALHLRFDGEAARAAAERALIEDASRAGGLVSAVIPPALDPPRCAALLTWARDALGERAGAALPTPSAPTGGAVLPRWTRLGPHDLLVVPRAAALGRLGAFAREVVARSAAAAAPGAVRVVDHRGA